MFWLALTLAFLIRQLRYHFDNVLVLLIGQRAPFIGTWWYPNFKTRFAGADNVLAFRAASF
jgi:hypothetical protein